MRGPLLATSALCGLVALGLVTAPSAVQAQTCALTTPCAQFIQGATTTLCTLGSSCTLQTDSGLAPTINEQNVIQGALDGASTANVYTTITVSPGPTAHCTGTIASGATSCVLDNPAAFAPYGADSIVSAAASSISTSGTLTKYDFTYTLATAPLVSNGGSVVISGTDPNTYFAASFAASIAGSVISDTVSINTSIAVGTYTGGNALQFGVVIIDPPELSPSAGPSPSVPFQAAYTISGSTMSWTQPTWQTDTNATPTVVWDYSFRNVRFSDSNIAGGTIQCAVLQECYARSNFGVSQDGSGAFSFVKVGQFINTMVLDGFVVSGGALYKGSSCSTPSYGLFSMVGLVLCPGMYVPNGGGPTLYDIGAMGNALIENNIVEWSYDGWLSNPSIDADGTVVFSGNTFRFNGGGDGQSHDIYDGRHLSVIATNNLIDMAFNGNDLKVRSMYNTVVGNTLGTTAAILPNGSLLPDPSGNQLNMGDYGYESITNNTILTGDFHNNNNAIVGCGCGDPPLPNGQLIFNNNYLLADLVSQPFNNFIWPGSPMPALANISNCYLVTITNNTFVTTGTHGTPPILAAQGCVGAGNTFNGSAVATATQTLTYAPADSEPPTVVCDFSTGPTPCAQATSAYMLDPCAAQSLLAVGDGRYIAAISTQCNAVGAAPYVSLGLSGGTINAVPDSGTRSGLNIATTWGAVGSTINLGAVGDFNTSDGYFYGNGDNITLNYTAGGADNRYAFSGQNMTVTACLGIAASLNCLGAGYSVNYPGLPGIPTSGTIINNVDLEFMEAGHWTFKGVNWGQVIYACAPLNTVICSTGFLEIIFDPATFESYRLGTNTAFGGTALMEGAQYAWPAYPAADGGFASSTYPGTGNYYYNLTGPWNIGSKDDVVWGGTGTSAAISNGFAWPTSFMGAIVGNAGNTFNVGVGGVAHGPVEIESVNGYGGGTILASAYETNLFAKAVGYVTNTFTTSTAGGAETLTAPDGGKIVFAGYTGAVSTTPPATGSVVITVASTQVITGGATTALAAASFTDAPLTTGGYPGMYLLMERVGVGTFVTGGNFTDFSTVSANGHTISMLAPLLAVNNALAADTYIAHTSNDTRVISICDPFGACSTASSTLIVGSIVSTAIAPFGGVTP